MEAHGSNCYKLPTSWSCFGVKLGVVGAAQILSNGGVPRVSQRWGHRGWGQSHTLLATAKAQSMDLDALHHLDC